jgi:hypothetical protein|tara:strand:- start:40 stop:660 length:621 start_codon:yes stop_codon:yes gene_type:complete
MAIKDVQRGFEVPPGKTVPDESPGAVLNTESVAVEQEVEDNLAEPTKDDEGQLDMALGAIKDFIWDEGYDEIVNRLEGSEGNLEEAIGEMAGRMVNREVMASDEGGNSINRDLLYALGAEVVNELYNVAEREGIYKSKDERANQEAQGEALIYATQKYVDMGDDQIDPSGSMKLAANALRGQYPQEETMPRMGMPVGEEMIDMEAV